MILMFAGFAESGSNVYLLAGAPTALSQQPGLNRTGGVFYCPVTTNTNDCRQVDITMKGKITVTDRPWRRPMVGLLSPIGYTLLGHDPGIGALLG